MCVEKRAKLVRMIEKMESNKGYSEKLGLVNKSYIKEDREKRLINKKC